MAENEMVPVTPMALLQMGQSGGASIEQMTKLMELQFAWEANEAKKAYHVAISAFKAEGVRITKDTHVSFGNTNYKHASLGNVVEKITAAMSKHDLSNSWSVTQDGNKIEVVCKVSHIMGHSETTKISAGADKSGSKNEIQQIGSTITYLERYSLLAALGLATHDDDGKAEEGRMVDTVNDNQLANIDALLLETGANIAGFCAYMKVKCLADIPAAHYGNAIKKIEEKRDERAAKNGRR